LQQTPKGAALPSPKRLRAGRCKALGKYPPHCAATSRQSRTVPLPGFDIVFFAKGGLTFGIWTVSDDGVL